LGRRAGLALGSAGRETAIAGGPDGAGDRRKGNMSGQLADRDAIGQTSSLERAARIFATRCHARQQRASDGARFIEHPLEVARLLRDAGCSDVVVAAGLLHDVVEGTSVSFDELAARFGAEVAELVRAVSDDARISSYRLRKRLLREQVDRAGGNAALVFAADKISKVRELQGDARREHSQQLRLEHYRESLGMLQRIAPQHPLVQRLARELDARPFPSS
jgi:(p)ppGpp synthase/HD superfamily hydrolase